MNKNQWFLRVLLPGILLAVSQACTTHSGDGFDPIKEQGKTVLPNLSGSKFLPERSDGGDVRVKTEGSTTIDWGSIERLLTQARDQAEAELIAVFSVRDSSGGWYNYYLQPLGFSPQAMEEANGNTQMFMYELNKDEAGSVPRIAIAVIPEGEQAFKEMEYWILPKVNTGPAQEKLKSTCEYVKVAPAATVCWRGGCTYYPPVYDWVCEGGGGDENWTWPEEEGSGGRSGSGGRGRPGRDQCLPPNMYIHGKCVSPIEKPCPGDPVRNPEIAPQTRSGVNGGRYGNTRSNGTQFHGGLDIKNDIGASVYNMYSGTVVSVGHQDGGLGHFVTVQFGLNENYYTVQYAHLEGTNMPANGSNISAGDKIGSQGTSGNLARAIALGLGEPHIHLIAKRRTGNGWNLENDYSIMDPEELLKTKFDENGNVIESTSCTTQN